MNTTHLDAIRDPAFHRFLVFGEADRAREEALGRPLLPHEAQSRLSWPQAEIIRRVERAVAMRQGEVITVLCARQTGKNETEAHLEDRALDIWQGIPGSVWVRTAPTWRPQIINSKDRLEKFTTCDPFISGRVRWREGFVAQVGHSRVQFMSGGAQANVVGATASVALSVDEAHKIDRGKFEEDFAPFTASTNAPTILWGVAADRLDLLHEYREANEGTDRGLVFPASVWCELSKAYAGHYEARKAALGDRHPVILTQYDLVAVESIGSYLNPGHRAALFSGDHPPLEGPRAGMAYIALVDIGGESELDADSQEVAQAEPGRDSTFLWILERDRQDPGEPRVKDGPGGYNPRLRIVHGRQWVGESQAVLIPALCQVMDHWNVEGGAIDARGVGEATAMAVNAEFPQVEAYKATATSVSEDCFDLLARVNLGRVKMYRADPALDPIRRELEAQARHTRYQIHGHEQMNLAKPSGQGSSGLHIDGVKALTYIGRALSRPHAGLMSYMAGRMEAQKPKG